MGLRHFQNKFPNPFTKVAATAKEKEAANIKLIAAIFFMYFNDLCIFS